MARRIAVDILQERMKEVFVQLKYTIGYDQPLQATLLLMVNMSSSKDIIYHLKES